MLAERLGFLRRNSGLTQEQLAAKLGVKKQTVSNWENSNIMPSVDMVERMADFFSVSVDYILGRAGTKKENLKSIDVTGLTDEEIIHIKAVVDDLRGRKR